MNKYELKFDIESKKENTEYILSVICNLVNKKFEESIKNKEINIFPTFTIKEEDKC